MLRGAGLTALGDTWARVAVGLVALTFVACSAGCSSDPTPAPTSSTASSSTPPSSSARSSRAVSSSPARSSSSSSRPPVSAAQAALDAMSEKGRVGQLLMVDCPSSGVTDATATAVRRYRVGSVILDGTSQQGLSATRNVTAQLRGLAPKGVGLFVATDQEGGLVQRLQGPGFSSIPSAVVQGGVAPDRLHDRARQWGAELRRAGINVNLAPVLDTVPAGGGANPPIGDLDREYGHTPKAVTTHGLAVTRGMLDAGIDPTVKHFPGLGRVSGNTDTTGGVIDTVTTRRDAYLAPFRAAVQAGVPFVMISTAIYSKIDPGTPAAFSRRIVTGMLRGDLGFRKVVISDDIGIAKQVGQYSPGQRAVRFVAAGGDIVLTVNAGQAAEMTTALLTKAKSDPAFRRLVDAAALRVLQAKQARGLL